MERMGKWTVAQRQVSWRHRGRRRTRCGIAWLVRVILLAAVAAPVGSAQEAGRVRVLTTILPLYSFACGVAGHSATVQPLLPPGVGPHDFQFSPGDLRKLSQADLLIEAGLGLDSWLTKPLEQMKSSGPKVIIASAGMDRQLIRGATGIHSGTGGEPRGAENSSVNPHFWLDPILAMRAVSNIAAALIAADSAHAVEYRANAAVYQASLLALDREMESGLAPLKERGFVTYHDAFPYLARRYHLNLIGVVEQTPDVEPSLHYLKQLVDAMRRQKARVIFTEPQFSPKLARQIAQDLGISVAELDPLETGPTRAGAYQEGMRRNLRILKDTLK